MAGFISKLKSDGAGGLIFKDTDNTTRKPKKARTSLFETEGGSAGQEVGAGGTTQRNTLLGN